MKNRASRYLLKTGIILILSTSAVLEVKTSAIESPMVTIPAGELNMGTNQFIKIPILISSALLWVSWRILRLNTYQPSHFHYCLRHISAI